MQLTNIIVDQDPELAMDIDEKPLNSFTLEELEGEPGYYKSCILPMLNPGHEGEFMSWLKSNGLIPTFVKCNKLVENAECGGKMLWTFGKVIDKYQWKCLKCKRRKSIRTNSIFQETRCRIQDAFRMFYGFCKGIDIEVMAKILCSTKQAVTKMYSLIAYVAKQYIEKHIFEFKLGGPGTIVLIDLFPSKFMGTNDYNNQIIPILCIAEVKHTPTRYWFHVFDRHIFTNKRLIQNANDTALNIVQKIVHSESILVANLYSTICNYDVLQSLKHLYPVIVTVDGLTRHNNREQSIENNLDMIWRNATRMCEEVQDYTMPQIETFFTSYLWKQRFEKDAFERLLDQISHTFV